MPHPLDVQPGGILAKPVGLEGKNDQELIDPEFHFLCPPFFPGPDLRTDIEDNFYTLHAGADLPGQAQVHSRIIDEDEDVRPALLDIFEDAVKEATEFEVVL